MHCPARSPVQFCPTRTNRTRVRTHGTRQHETPDWPTLGDDCVRHPLYRTARQLSRAAVASRFPATPQATFSDGSHRQYHSLARDTELRADPLKWPTRSCSIPVTVNRHPDGHGQTLGPGHQDPAAQKAMLRIGQIGRAVRTVPTAQTTQTAQTVPIVQNRAPDQSDPRSG